jgi:hypothetical protein
MKCHNLEIFRNCAYEYPLSLVDTSGYAEGIYGWQFGLVIGATNPSRVFGPSVIIDTAPSVSSGSSSVTFILSAEQTALLMIGTAYEYRVIAQPPGFDQGVLEYGNVRVFDAPLIFG